MRITGEWLIKKGAEPDKMVGECWGFYFDVPEIDLQVSLRRDTDDMLSLWEITLTQGDYENGFGQIELMPVRNRGQALRTLRGLGVNV